MPDFLAVDVDRANGLPTAILCSHSCAVVAGVKGKVSDGLQISHVPVKVRAVLLCELSTILLDRGDDLWEVFWIGQFISFGRGMLLSVACSDGGLS